MREMTGLGWPKCTCNVGAKMCGVHPKKRMTKEDHIAFRKKWDDRVAKGSVDSCSAEGR